MTYKKLRELLSVTVSDDTLHGEIKAYGLTNWLAKRLAWCKEREYWGFEEWSKVIWSDECSVERGTGKERVWVFQFPHEKKDKRNGPTIQKGEGYQCYGLGCVGDDRTPRNGGSSKEYGKEGFYNYYSRRVVYHILASYCA